VGLVAGWLAGQITRGAGYGLVGDLIIGVIGAYIGDWLLPRLGILLGAGLVAAIIDATIGAMLLLFVFRLLAGRRRWGGGWGRRWGLPWERRANLREMNSLPAAPSQGKPIGGVAFLGMVGSARPADQGR
jgi:uncharacterized membrane protein YeaQ/YmgE (transglycosylase-associated protein family)